MPSDVKKRVLTRLEELRLKRELTKGGGGSSASLASGGESVSRSAR